MDLPAGCEGAIVSISVLSNEPENGAGRQLVYVIRK